MVIRNPNFKDMERKPIMNKTNISNNKFTMISIKNNLKEHEMGDVEI